MLIINVPVLTSACRVQGVMPSWFLPLETEVEKIAAAKELGCSLVLFALAHCVGCGATLECSNSSRVRVSTTVRLRACMHQLCRALTIVLCCRTCNLYVTLVS